MEKMNQDIPFEHQMMFIIRDYDRKVEENMELRKEVEELSAALEKQGVQLYDAKVDLKNEIKKEEEAEKALKKKPTFDEKVLQKQMTDLKKKNKILSKQVNQLLRKQPLHLDLMSFLMMFHIILNYNRLIYLKLVNNELQ